MNSFFFNRYGVLSDLKQHIYLNRKKYFFGLILFCVAFAFGINTGNRIVNPVAGLYQHNKAHYLLLTVVGKDNYTMSQVTANLFSMVLLFLSCLHYFFTPLSIFILFQKVYNVGITIVLLFRIKGIGALLVVTVSIIPIFLILFGIYLFFVIYLFNTSQECFRYGQSKWLIFETRNMWARLLWVFVLIILVSWIGGMLTIALGSSSI